LHRLAGEKKSLIIHQLCPRFRETYLSFARVNAAASLPFVITIQVCLFSAEGEPSFFLDVLTI